MSASMEDALTGAILRDRDEPRENRLYDADFGKYADGSGYWWTLRYTREIRNGEVEDGRQDEERRAGMIVREWAKTRARLESRE